MGKEKKVVFGKLPKKHIKNISRTNLSTFFDSTTTKKSV